MADAHLNLVRATLIDSVHLAWSSFSWFSYTLSVPGWHILVRAREQEYLFSESFLI